MLERCTIERGNSGSERMLSQLLNNIPKTTPRSTMVFDSHLHEEQTNKPKFLPSQERIKNMCVAFQRSWTDRERDKRARLRQLKWSVPEVSVCLDSLEIIDD